MNATDRIQLLLTRYRGRTITSAEFDELLVWMDGLNEEQSAELVKKHEELWEQAKAGQLSSTGEAIDWDSMLRKVMRPGEPAGVHRQAGKVWWRVAAAAAVLIMVVLIYLQYDRKEEVQEIAGRDRTLVRPEAVLPNINQTVLTMPDGRRIVLDSAVNGSTLPVNAAITVKLQEGVISYQAPAGNVVPEYHTISVPRGGRPYSILLADGSKVWLNAASSLRFPSFFNREHHSVELSGEGYFDIEPHPKGSGSSSGSARPSAPRVFPFIVRNRDMTIEVMGTQFNVMAYDDESSIQTTLLEGSVKIATGKEQTMLTPGNQAQITTEGNLNVGPANTAMAVAWVNGYFQFDKADIKSILRQVGRWYDLEIEYRGKVPDDLFSGKIERALPLSGILKLLASGRINIEVEHKKLIVL